MTSRKGMDIGGILLRFHGTAVHDCWLPYWKYDCDHAACCVRLLRELNDVMDNRPDQRWPRQFKALLLFMKKAKERRISKGYLVMSAYYLRKFSAAYDAVVALGKTENPVSEPNTRKKDD